MRLTLHIVQKDLARMRVWIAGWVALLLAPIGMGAWFIGHNPLPDEDWHLQNEVAFVVGVQVMVAYLLTILVLQEDSVVGTRQFWLTRPISRGRLLAAKAISVVVIVGLVPVAVSVPWWLWCGFTAGQIAAAGGEIVLLAMLAMAPAAVMAVLTDSFPRALLWTVALAAVLLFVGFGFTVLNADVVQGKNIDLVMTRALLAIGALAIEMFALVTVQFLVRRRGWWVGAAAGLMVVSVLIAAQWRWSWFQQVLPERDAERAANVAVRFAHAAAGAPPERQNRPGDFEPLQRVETGFVVSSVAPDLGLLGATAEQRWTWPDGTRIERVDAISGSSNFATVAGLAIPQRQEWRRAIAYRTGRALGQNEDGVIVQAWLPPSLVARMQKEPPKFEARLSWRILRPEVRLEVPMATGPWMARRGHGVGIAQLEQQRDTVIIKLVSTRPILLSPLLRGKSVEWLSRFDPNREQSWMLFDRERGKVVYMFGERHADKTRAIIVNGVKIEWRAHVLVKGGRYVAGSFVPDPNWRPGTSLGVVTMREEAVFYRNVQVDRFEPAPAP